MNVKINKCEPSKSEYDSDGSNIPTVLNQNYCSSDKEEELHQQRKVKMKMNSKIELKTKMRAKIENMKKDEL